MKKIKKLLMELAKKNLIFRKVFRISLNLYRLTRYKFRGIGQKTDEKMILFSCFNGKSYADSPKAIYNCIKENDKYSDYKFIWAFSKPKNYKYLEKNNKNTVVLKVNTKQYEKYLSKAKYWIFNYRAADHQYPKKNQVFLQCWHGTPLKRLGYDLDKPDNVLNTKKEIRYKYKTDAKKFKYILSPSKFASEKFISAWNLKKAKKENAVIEEGYPRNDFLINYTDEDIKEIKQKLGINKTNKKVILYAPTWRDNQHQSGLGYTYKTEVDFDKLKEEIGEEFIILFRAHYLVANQFDFEKYKGFIYDVSSLDDINELYVISDILITDYSSVFFDYANLKRPVIYYMYDLEKYKDNMRGFYIDLNELPGSIVKTEKQLIEEIKNVTKNFEYDEKYKKFNEKYNYLDDGKASERVIERVIE